MIVLSGGDVVLPDRIVQRGSVILDRGRIVAIEPDPVAPAGATIIDVTDSTVVPGFIDVHVHGVEGHDTLDGGGVVSEIARALPRYGVTAFCPTTVACGPDALQEFLDEVRSLGDRPPGAARVLPAHLESNFINPEFRGAQPIKCLRVADEPRGGVAWPFTGSQILETIENSRSAVGIVTLAPELPGGIELIRSLVAAGHVVSLGHSGADFDTAVAAIEAGATHATHLFNRMTPVAHRAPGLADHPADEVEVVHLHRRRRRLGGAGATRGCRRADLRWLPRTSGDVRRRDRGERAVPHDGNFRRHIGRWAGSWVNCAARRAVDSRPR